jgi:DNA modification methylase
VAIPSQGQLMLPLLSILDERGSARPKDIYDDLAERIGLSKDDRNHTTVCSGQKVNEYERTVRWTRQTGVVKGLIQKGERAAWRLTENAKAKLGNMRRGTILTFAIGENGFLLWANAEDAVTVIEKERVQLLMTSPPYPLHRKREYGNVPPNKWVYWMLAHIERFLPLITKDGSMMLNIGRTWEEGMPAQSLHIERLLVALEDRLGVHLLEELSWHNPTKLPPLQWVGKQRMRVTPSVEPILWLSHNPYAYGNNLAVLRPYSKKGLREILNPRERSKRPCGEKFDPTSFVDRGGSIPPSLLQATPTGKDDAAYRRAMRAAGMEPHPATLPTAVARFGILLATRKGDTVLDPFSGSGTVPIEAMRLGRRGIGFERSRLYNEGAIIRAQTADVQLLAA